MKILLAPSETKTNFCDSGILNQKSFIFEDLFEKRVQIIEIFQKECDDEIFIKDTTKAMLRYDGVAYNALDYKSLVQESQNYVDKNVIIFSNIFGPILGGDEVPPYRFKQGSKLDEVNIEKLYKEYFSSRLDEFAGEFIVDLRAGFYEKFYIPNVKTYTYKFLKNGKVVSHWAKFYRGLIVREMAKNNIQAIKELLNLQIENLKVLEIVESKNLVTIICNIGD